MEERSSRFDDLVRTERYFSATLLPLVLFHGTFNGLRSFVRLVDERTTHERRADGTAVPRSKKYTRLPEPLGGDWLEFITEFHIARDLRAGNQVPLDDDPADERPKRDAPDVVIVLGDEVLVCEAKFFGRWTADDVAAQMASQRAQIAHLFAARPSLRAYRHIALLPRPIPLDIDAVVTWQEIAHLASSLRPIPEYAAERLAHAAARYAPPGNPRVRNWDGSRLPLPELIVHIQERQAQGQRTQIGYDGGLPKLRLATPAELESRRLWKWRDPDTNQGPVAPEHWISDERFLQIICSLGATPKPGTDTERPSSGL
jgi:hypothetical protein